MEAACCVDCLDVTVDTDWATSEADAGWATVEVDAEWATAEAAVDCKV